MDRILERCDGKREKFEMSPYTRRLYDSASGRFFHRRRLKRIIRICRQVTANRVLEIGCHDLFLYNLVGDRFASYIGIDANWEGGLSYAEQNRRKLGWDNVAVIEALAENLPFKDCSFDLVCCFETLEHLVNEEAAIKELSRLLSKDGKALVSVPIEFGLFLLVKAMARYFLRRKKEYSLAEIFQAAIICQPAQVQRFGHKGYDYRNTVRLLQESGLEVGSICRYPVAWSPDWINGGVILSLEKRHPN